MNGDEDIKVGDELLCISNEGLSSVGDKRIIKGLTETSINFSGAATSWIKRKDVRWKCYSLINK